MNQRDRKSKSQNRKAEESKNGEKQKRKLIEQREREEKGIAAYRGRENRK